LCCFLIVDYDFKVENLVLVRSQYDTVLWRGVEEFNVVWNFFSVVSLKAKMAIEEGLQRLWLFVEFFLN
jgi:hypothetical protein